MAPESERANVSECVRCKDGECFLNRCPCTCHILSPQTPPTLTCSEVVERLATEAFRPAVTKFHDAWFNRAIAMSILHSWRERRVQELEEALGWLLPMIRGMSNEKLAPGRGYLMGSPIFKQAEKVMSDEWREQIRKGAKHD